MKHVYIHAVGLAAPGLPNWADAQTVLRGESPYLPEPLTTYRSTLLPRNEARRAGTCVRIALQAAEQVFEHIDARKYATVFASAHGDLEISDKICTALSTPARDVSPTQFHNSVHNAAAGYWSIATGSKAAANSVAAGRDTFSVALQESWAMLCTENSPVLLVCFDIDGDGKLAASRSPICGSAALALALSSDAHGAIACLGSLTLTDRAPTKISAPKLEQLRQHNPPARGLPLLVALARKADGEIVIESNQGNLSVEVQCLA